MKKILIGVFAHPDDEAFGCSPTLIKEVRDGNDVHLITLTAGEGGTNHDNHEDLATIRLDEWRRGGALMGVQHMEYLGYADGKLDNQMMVAIADHLMSTVQTYLDSTDNLIEFMTFEFGGITGHIDHIVAARATALAHCRLRDQFPDRIGRLRLRFLHQKDAPLQNTEWIYMAPGYPDDEIDEVIDAREYHDTIVEVIRCHQSQRHDGEAHIARYGSDLGLNYFIVR